MIRALIDLDPMKYAVGFAAQHEEYYKLKSNCWPWDKVQAMARTGGMDCFEYTKAAGFVQEAVQIKKVTGVKGLELNHEDGAKEQFPDTKSKAELVQQLGLVGPGIILDPLENCLHSVRMMVNKVIKATGAGSYTAYISRGDCFRVQVYPYTLDEVGMPLKDDNGRPVGYKANRIGNDKPVYMPQIEEYMQRKFNAVLCTDIEADDAICIEHTQSADETVICTIDKDLDGCPGWHYNWNTKLLRDLSPAESLTHYWCQVLTGDRVDNIPGLQGVGPAFAEKILAGAPVQEMKNVVFQEYTDRGHDEQYFRMNCILLWMLRKPLADTYPDEEWANDGS